MSPFIKNLVAFGCLILFCMIFGFVIGAFDYSSSDNTATSSDLDVSARAVGQERLRSSLRDPDSLQIIDEEVVTSKNGSMEYRATYRAKNGFGGYVEGEYYTD